jgi:hypothetical protein
MACTDAVTQSITVEDFKNQFYRDFVYVNTWAAGTYNTGDKVFYNVNFLFYECLQDGVVTIPTTSVDWKEISNIGLISDKDITNAYTEACMNFNVALFSNDADIKLAYLYLAAHYLVYDLNAGGLESTNGGLVNSRSVGNVSESYTIPEWQLNHPTYSFYTRTSYGLKYLNMILPKLIGNFNIAEGRTNA